MRDRRARCRRTSWTRAALVCALALAVRSMTGASTIGVLALANATTEERGLVSADGAPGVEANAETTSTNIVKDVADDEEAADDEAEDSVAADSAAADPAAADPAATTEPDAEPDSTTMRTIEDENEEDADDNTASGAGKEEVRSADDTFESASVTKPSAPTSNGEAVKDDEQLKGGVTEPHEMTEKERSAAIESAVKERLESLYSEPTEKQKNWLAKVKQIHALEGATSFTEEDATCGSTGGLAVFTVWDHVPEVARDAIAAFLAADMSESKSPHSLLSLRAKAIRLVSSHEVSFKGRGSERNECIANYFTRQKVHEIMQRMRARKEERISRAHETYDHTLLKAATDYSEDQGEQHERRVGRVAKELKKVIITQIEKLDKQSSEQDRAKEAGGTSYVLALNCRAQHQHRLVAAVVHAIRAKFGLGASDFTLVVGKRAVEDELNTLLGKSYDTLMAQRSEKASTDVVKSRIEVCPDLPGIAPADDAPERELSEMEKVMRRAEEQVLIEYQGNDPTNPHHMNSGTGLGLGALPGMPKVFNEQSFSHKGDGSARSEARKHFGINDHMIGTHNTDHLRRGPSQQVQPRDGTPRQRTQGGFNAMPKMKDPLASYLSSDAIPRKYERRAERH